MVGFKYGALLEVAREQHTPETCWAAAMAMASGLLGKDASNNEMAWYQKGRRSGLVKAGTTRILPEALRDLIRGLPGFTVELYSMLGLARALDAALKNDQIVLLMSEEHVILLGQIQMHKQSGEMTYHVIDPADGQVVAWTQAKLNEFKPTEAAVIGKT